jgi:hypothetical protein
MVFCVLFGLLLVAPAFLTVTNLSLTTPLEENRNREPFPQLSSCGLLHLDDCHGRVDAWFNDNYGPRDLLIKLKTQVDYSVFHVSDKVHIGPDNWLFYRSTMDTEKVAAERISQEQFKNLLGQFDSLDKYLKQRGIQLIVLPIPLKDEVYPEYLPGSVPNLPENSRYQQLRKWLAGHESIWTIDAYEFLLERKRTARAFHKTDFHWNDPAGFLFAERLVNHLWAHQSPIEEPLWAHSLSVITRDYSGGQANFLPLLSAPREQGLFLEFDWQSAQGVHDYSPSNAAWSYTYDGRGEPRGRLDGLVVIGDSYFDAMQRAGIDTYFTSVHRASNQAEGLAAVYSALPEGTRYLVFEFIEASLFGLSYHGLSVPGPSG